MAIIYSYPVITPTADDLLLGTDQGGDGKPTKNFTIQSIVDLLQAGATGLGAVIEINSSAKNAAGGNQSATDFLNIQGTGSASFNSFTDGNMTITGGIGNGFTSIRSTDFVGNITGIVKAGSSIEGAVTGVTQALGTSNTTLATTAFVMSKTDPSVLTFLGTTGGNQTVNLAAQTLSLLGTTSEIKTVSSAQTLTISLADGAFGSGTELILPNGASATTQAAADNTVKVATTAFVKQENDAQDLDFTGDSGTSSVLLNSQTLDFEGTALQVTTAVTAQKVKFTLPTNVTIGGVFTGVTFAGDLNGTVNTLTTGVTQTAGDASTKIATTKYVDDAAGAKTLQYQGDTGGPFDLNLKDDDLDIAGGSNISTTAATVATNLGVITINLNDNVTISGTSKADTFTTTAGTATWVTTVLAGFTSITSDTFIGDSTASATDFQGNASSATKLGSSDGTIQLKAGSGVTQGVSSSAVIYTNGGDIELTTSLINTTVTAKTLQGLPTPAAATVVASDTILQGFGKLQSQINGIANGLQFQGTWNASMDTGGTDNTPGGTPALASGGGEASSGTTDATTANELVDSTKNFTAAPNIVAVGDKVINQADGQEALVTAITNAASGRLELAADIMLTGEAYIIDKTPFITAGHYYVVDAVGATTARNATLNGIQDWQVGDWVIASVNNVWQKLNNSAVEGSGTENRLTKWAAAASTLVDSGIIDNGTTIKLENDTELGGAAGDAISSVGVHTIDEQLILKKGLGLLLSDGATPPVFSNNYGTSGQVLTSAGASSDTPTWTTPTTGVVESITGGTGITVDDSSNPGTAAIPVVSIDYTGTDNVVLGAGTAVTPVGADTIIINDATSGNAVKALISNLPFDNYSSWDLAGDSGTAQAISSGNTATFAGGTGVVTSVAATDTLTTALRYDDSDNAGTIKNFIESAATLAPAAADFLIFGDQAGGSAINKVKKATIADIVDLGNETLAEVLANGNNSGGAKDINMTGAISNITLVDSGTAATLNAAQGRIKIGSGDDLQLYHNGTSSFIANATGDLNISSDTSIKLSFISGEAALLAIKDNQLNLYYNGLQRMNTSSAGITVSGTITSGDVNTSGLLGSRVQLARNAVPTVNNILGTIGFRGDAFGGTTLSVIDTAAIQASAEIDWAANVYGTRLTFKTTTGQTQSTALTLRGDNDAEFTGNVEIDGNLTVDGAIIHGGGGGGTAKGGTFTKLYTTGNASVAGVAFTISRATTGVMIFDVMLTSDTSTACAVAKKYTVVKSYGASPFYNKILDTGPDFDTSDFTVAFAQDTTDLSIKCTITPVYTNTQKIGITLDLGFGQHDATVVMN